MEVGLGGVKAQIQSQTATCLNPCFNGSRSRRWFSLNRKVSLEKVLILVLMEVGLGDIRIEDDKILVKLS